MGCCEWCSTYFRAAGRWLNGILQIGICIAIINIVYWQLTSFEISYNNETIDYKCALTTDAEGDSLCTYAFIISGATIVACLFLMMSVCLKCACWLYVEFWTDWIFTLLGLIWWIATGMVFAYYNNKTKEQQTQSDDKQPWRNAVTVLAWVMALLFFADFVGSQFRLCYKVCGFCGGKQERERLATIEREKKEKEEADAAAAKAAAAAGMAPTAPGTITMDPENPTSSPRGVPEAASNPSFWQRITSKTETKSPSVTKPSQTGTPGVAVSVSDVKPGV